ncbi:MAG: N-acetyl-gamma-glutamyl-phosphate reductase [bacterium]
MSEIKARVGILGGASLTARELLKLLSRHPQAEVTYIESTTECHKTVSSVHRIFRRSSDRDLTFSSYDADTITAECNILFSCKPHGSSRKAINGLLDSGLKIIDLSADYRLADPGQYKIWYERSEDYSQRRGSFVYGIPEINRELIKKSSHIANPGCYVTSVILGVAPLMKHRSVVTSGIVINSFSGVSGAGRSHKPGKNLFIDLDSNLIPYSHVTHGHTPEIEQELGLLAGSRVTVTFLPHIVPISRGILSTIILKPTSKMNKHDLVDLYDEFYRDEPLVSASTDLPEISMVTNTNRCQIGLNLDKRNNLIIITSVIDNLLKGASGQAIQNMNLICGFPEFSALPY